MPRDSRRRARSLGNFGERVAASHLESKGYAILERNWSSPEGEIDIIASRGTDLVFVEVRSRRGRNFGTPEESITGRKAQHVRAAAAAYVQEHPESPPNQRIDVVSLELDAKGRVLRVE
ncbi:MAG TPA: YraN family protein, partial [Dehalococcoidia bacterium]|nr:YraN family protein [Dehalococcoidia bacterium]